MILPKKIDYKKCIVQISINIFSSEAHLFQLFSCVYLSMWLEWFLNKFQKMPVGQHNE